METTQEVVQEVKSAVQEDIQVAESPLVVRLKSERVQEPDSVSRTPVSTLYELEVNERKRRVVIDIWDLQVQITLEEASAAAVRAGEGS